MTAFEATTSERWDSFVEWLSSLAPQDRVEALQDPEQSLEQHGLGDATGVQLNDAIVNSNSFNRDFGGNTVTQSGGTPPPNPNPLPGETPHEAAERVFNYYITNNYSYIDDRDTDNSTNIGGDNYGDIESRNVTGDDNVVASGDGSVIGDHSTGGNVVDGDGNTTALGEGDATNTTDVTTNTGGGDANVNVADDGSEANQENYEYHAEVMPPEYEEPAYDPRVTTTAEDIGGDPGFAPPPPWNFDPATGEPLEYTELGEPYSPIVHIVAPQTPDGVSSFDPYTGKPLDEHGKPIEGMENGWVGHQFETNLDSRVGVDEYGRIDVEEMAELEQRAGDASYGNVRDYLDAQGEGAHSTDGGPGIEDPENVPGPAGQEAIYNPETGNYEWTDPETGQVMSTLIGQLDTGEPGEDADDMPQGPPVPADAGQNYSYLDDRDTDNSTNIGGDNRGDIENRNVTGDDNVVASGDGSVIGDHSTGGNVVDGDGNTTAFGEGDATNTTDVTTNTGGGDANVNVADDGSYADQDNYEAEYYEADATAEPEPESQEVSPEQFGNTANLQTASESSSSDVVE